MYRGVVMTEEAFQNFVRDTNERLAKIEGGSVLRGRVSLDKVIQVGDVEISALPGGGSEHGIEIKVRNIITGEEQVLATLP